jgi:hypothetical protein
MWTFEKFGPTGVALQLTDVIANARWRNVAVICAFCGFERSSTSQPPLSTELHPVQLSKKLPVPGAVKRDTDALGPAPAGIGKVAVHTVAPPPQFIPDGNDWTFPVPLPANATLIVRPAGAAWKLAIQDVFFATTRETEAAVPAQSPDQPVKMELGPGWAISVIGFTKSTI